MLKKKRPSCTRTASSAVPVNTHLLFAHALIEANGNATEAARRVFKLGSKGGKDVQRTAESMGSQYLRKVEVQRHLAGLLDSVAMNRNWVLLRLKQLGEQERDQHLALKSITLVAHLLKLLPEEQRKPDKDGELQRKTLFLLKPPEIPVGGKPSPQLIEQWREGGIPEHVLADWQQNGMPAEAEMTDSIEEAMGFHHSLCESPDRRVG